MRAHESKKPALALLSRLGLVLAAGVTLPSLLPGCSDEPKTPTGTVCESHEACEGGFSCSPGGRDPGCGRSSAVASPPDPCATDAECASFGVGTLCHSEMSEPFSGPTCALPCKDDSRCATGTTCDVAGGRCRPATACTADSCGATQVCAVNGACTPRLCSASNQCGPGFSCDELARCSPAACDEASPCPINFACTAGRCAIRTCKTTAECPGSFCVNGVCNAEQGRCYEITIICGRPLISDGDVLVAALVRGATSDWTGTIGPLTLLSPTPRLVPGKRQRAAGSLHPPSPRVMPQGAAAMRSNFGIGRTGGGCGGGRRPEVQREASSPGA